MGKAGSLKQLVRRKEFWISFWGTFLAVLAMPSTVLSMMGVTFSLRVTSGLILFAISFSALINKHQWRKRHLPVRDIVPDDIARIGKINLCCPCDFNLVDEAKRLAQYWYPTETISPDSVEQLLAKNPYILVCLTGMRDELLGYFDVIPLKENFALRFLRGTVTESEITADDVFAFHEMALCKHVFISGLAVWDPDNHIDRRNASILVWGLLKYLDHFYSATKPLVFASAATKEGEDLLEKFYLKVGCAAAGRLDKRTLYVITLSHEEIIKRLICLPDWSFLCTLDWSPSDVTSTRKKLPQRRLRRIEAA